MNLFFCSFFYNFIITLSVLLCLGLWQPCRSGRGIIYTMVQIHKIAYKARNHELQTNGELSPKPSICRKFLKYQRPLCSSYYSLVPSVFSGFFMGINECQFQFSKHIWNCRGHNQTVVRKKNLYRITKKGKRKKRRNRHTYMDKLIARSTPESAFLLSVISAGVSHHVTKACSQGISEKCGCDATAPKPLQKSNFKWSGCSDNIDFGAAFARRFIDAQEKNRLKRKRGIALINMHNSYLGRETIAKKMRIKCKCHGVSGSCEIKTCSRNLPPFREVGDFLKDKFNKIIKMNFHENQLETFSIGFEYGEMDMLHLGNSPDHCQHNLQYGSLGTRGRICNSTVLKQPEDSCYKLCCQRGFHIKTYMKKENCRCIFKWCCKVECETCQRQVVEATCN